MRASSQSGEVFMVGGVLAVLAVFSFTGSPAESASPMAIDEGMPRTSEWTQNTEYYSFSATNILQANSLMYRRSPIAIDGEKFGGVMNFGWKWYSIYDDTGGTCSVNQFVIEGWTTITLPNWENQDKAPYAQRSEWDRAMKVLIRHEEKHARIAKAAGDEFERKANALAPQADCEILQNKLEELSVKYIQQANKYNAAYDKRTNHGSTEGVHVRTDKFGRSS